MHSPRDRVLAEENKMSKLDERLTGLHENCYDCAEFFHACRGWPGKEFACADFLNIPTVGVQGATGMKLPDSRMGGRTEPREIHVDEARGPDKTVTVRRCRCDRANLGPRERMCDQCRIEHRARTQQRYQGRRLRAG